MKITPFLEYVLYDAFGESEAITYRAMMGGYTLYKDGKVFAIVGNEKLYFKGSNDTESWYLKHGAEKFWYMKEEKIQYMNYFLIPNETLDSREEFALWFEMALSVATLPKKEIT